MPLFKPLKSGGKSLGASRARVGRWACGAPRLWGVLDLEGSCVRSPEEPSRGEAHGKVPDPLRSYITYIDICIYIYIYITHGHSNMPTQHVFFFSTYTEIRVLFWVRERFFETLRGMFCLSRNVLGNCS